MTTRQEILQIEKLVKLAHRKARKLHRRLDREGPDGTEAQTAFEMDDVVLGLEESVKALRSARGA